MRSTKPGLAPLRTVEVTTKVIIEVTDGETEDGYSLAEEIGRLGVEAMLRGDTITFTPFQ